jgi:Flp pilus assembly protein TadD
MHEKAARRLAARAALLSTALCALTLGGCDTLGGIGTFIAGRETPSTPSGSIKTETVLDFADRARANGEYPRALGLYRRALADDNSNERALIGVGETLLAMGQPSQAAEAFSRAVENDSKSAEALRGLGSAYLALNQPQRAIDVFEKANAIAPDSRAYDGLGVANDLTGNFAGAKAAYQQGLGVSPNDLMLRNNLGLSLALAGEYDAAITVLRSVATDPAAGPRQRSNLALALALAGHTDQAAEIARIDLDDATVQRNLANYAELRALPPDARAQALLHPDASKPKPSAAAMAATPGLTPPSMPMPLVQNAPIAPPAAVAAATPPPIAQAGPTTEQPMPRVRHHRVHAHTAPPPTAESPSTTEPSTTEAPLPKGKAWAQVGAFRIESNATAMHDRVTKEDQDLLQGAQVEIRHGSLNRVLIGPLDSRAQAEKLCASLQDRKIDCIPVRR